MVKFITLISYFKIFRQKFLFLIKQIEKHGEG